VGLSVGLREGLAVIGFFVGLDVVGLREGLFDRGTVGVLVGLDVVGLRVGLFDGDGVSLGARLERSRISFIRLN